MWKYLDDGSDQGTAWRATAFDDSAWAQGAGQLGFGNTPATTLNTGATTYYFRHRFQVGAAQIDAARASDGFYRMIFGILRDDGAVVYLNGVEILRSNMDADGIITAQTLAAGTVSGTDETSYHTELFDSANALQVGDNVLAVEVHQVTTTSSDIGFDLELSIEPRGDFWKAGPEMTEPRREHTAVLLNDGRVLIAGGRGPDGPLNTAEIFDPLTNTWTPTGALNVARSYHQAILLADGRVLVMSGRVNGVDIESCEVYDPNTSAWTEVGDLDSGRFAPLVVRLQDGRILIAGGFEQGNSNDFLRTCELFDPATESWTNTGSYVTGANKQIGFVLADGRVLSAGGYDGGASRHQNAELYNPATGSWANTGFMAERRYRYAGALLDDGRVLAIAGGNDGTSNNLSSEIYNPATGQWSGAGALAVRRRDISSAMLPDGRVIIAGGGIAASEVFDPATATWTAGGNLQRVRSDFTMTALLDGRTLVTGGGSGGVIQSDTETYGARSNPPFTEWMAGFAGLTPQQRLRFANPDSDDLVNILEHAFGLNPTDATDALRYRLPKAVIDDDRIALQFVIPNPPPPDLILRVFAAGNLTAGERWVIATRTPDGIWSGAADVSTDFSNSSEQVISVRDINPFSVGSMRAMWLEVSVAAP